MCHSVLIGCLNLYNVSSLNQDVTVNTISYIMFKFQWRVGTPPAGQWSVLLSCVSVHTSIVQVQYTIHENTVCAGLMWCWVKRAFSRCILCPSLDGISCHCSLFFCIFISVSIYRWVHPDLWDCPSFSSASSLWHFACLMYVASPLSISSINSTPPPTRLKVYSC